MQELLMNAHELSFEYSTMDCNDLSKCPLAQKAKDLFKTVKKLHQLMKKLTPPPKPSATAVR